MLQNKLRQAQTNLHKKFLWRTRNIVRYSSTTHALVDGKMHLSFASNNYLGLANHPKVIAACQQALADYGVGSGSAYLVAGYSALHQQLEENLADFLQYPRVLLFSSGYLANIGIISSLFFTQDFILADKLNHASLLDGCLKSGARLKRYPHCQVQHIERECQNIADGNKLIVTEGLFGMDGTLAPLPAIAQTAKRHQATLLVDDAHGLGILGATGKGTVEHYGLNSKDVHILVGTLGKAFGSYGAFVAGQELVIERLVQTTRTYLYTTAIPPAIAAGSLASLELIQRESWRRKSLLDLVHYFQRCASQLEIPFMESISPIQLIMLGSNQRSLAISQLLLSKGIFVKAIRPPTVPKASARLRISLTSEHTREQIDFLMEALANALKYC
jgi:8-amino-7-oxononanoate synthase